MKSLRTVLVVLLSFVLSSCSVISNFIPTQTPYPTYTPYPTFTPIPSPSATPEKKVLLEESEFTSIDSCFDVASNADYRFSVDNGQYNMFVKTHEFYVWSTCDKEFRNFTLEVDASQVDGPDNNEYGVVFRTDPDTGAFYDFLVSGDGYYSLQIRNPSENQIFNLISWSQIREIKQGNKTNHIKVTAIGDQFELFVNGVLVGVARDSSMKSGPVGFMVGTYTDGGGVSISFDNLKVTEP